MNRKRVAEPMRNTMDVFFLNSGQLEKIADSFAVIVLGKLDVNLVSVSTPEVETTVVWRQLVQGVDEFHRQGKLYRGFGFLGLDVHDALLDSGLLQRHGVGNSKPRPSHGEYERSEEHTSELQSLRHLVCR